MEIISIKDNDTYLKEYIKACNTEWGKEKTPEELNKYIVNKLNQIKTGDKIISILGLIDNHELIGFISLFKYDGDSKRELTPWYATMYVKKEYRGKGYSRILNDAILKEAKELGYEKVYLKTELHNYYEKFGAVNIGSYDDKEKLLYFDLKKQD